MLSIFKRLEIVPAKLILALLTCDVIAATNLDDNDATLGAMLSTFLLLPDLKLGQLFIHPTCMQIERLVPTEQANTCRAFLALNYFPSVNQSKILAAIG